MLNHLICGASTGDCVADGSSDFSRANIMASDLVELGNGYAPGTNIYSHYWTQNFGAGPAVFVKPSPIAAAGHLFLTAGQTRYVLTYYDDALVQPNWVSVTIVLDYDSPQSYYLSHESGGTGFGSWYYEGPSSGECRSSYWFTVEDGSGQTWTYPEAGQLRNFGDGGCSEDYDPPSYNWDESGWSECSAPCDGGSQTQSVTCVDDMRGTVADDAYCTSPKPPTSQACNTDPCTYIWIEGVWGACSELCGGGTQSHTVECQLVETGETVADSYCAPPKPELARTCNTDPCTYTWMTGEWSACSVPCDGGEQTRTVTCWWEEASASVAAAFCAATEPVPEFSQVCNEMSCEIFSDGFENGDTQAWSGGEQ